MLGQFRAAAAEGAGIYILARRFGKDVLLARAAQIDVGSPVLSPVTVRSAMRTV